MTSPSRHVDPSRRSSICAHKVTDQSQSPLGAITEHTRPCEHTTTRKLYGILVYQTILNACKNSSACFQHYTLKPTMTTREIGLLVFFWGFLGKVICIEVFDMIPAFAFVLTFLLNSTPSLPFFKLNSNSPF